MSDEREHDDLLRSPGVSARRVPPGGGRKRAEALVASLPDQKSNAGNIIRMTKISVAWQGAPPPAALVRALRAGGVAFAARGQPADVSVHATATPRPPRDVPRDRPWLWVCAQPVAAATALAATRAGAYDVIELGRAAAAARLLARITELAQPAPRLEVPGVVAVSAAMQAALGEVARAAATSMPVLFTGETGTGKDVLARVVHARSARARGRLVAINCAAVPNELIESELFGYVRGAFSGAVADYDGQLAAAAGGTVFLDEIDDTPLTLQAKLLRVLEDRVISRLGENVWRAIDFRIVAATNRDPALLIERGVLADDLYQRLAIIQIHLPPLRDRAADLPGLVQHFVARYYADESGPHRHAVVAIADAALAALAAYAWPGNVRELRNVVYQALVGKRGGDELLAADLPPRLIHAGAAAAPPGLDRDAIDRALAARAFNLKDAVAALERTALTLALARSGGRAAGAATLLGEVGRGRARDPGATVRAMMRRFGVA
jgi:DNA-binding NtrC family response regulator